MRQLSFAAVLIPALLASTAIRADDSHPFFGIGANGGIAVLKLPSGQNGVLTTGNVGGGSDPLMIGGTLGLNGIVGIGKIGDWDGFIGVNLFGTYASGGGSRTQNFSGVGMIQIPGSSTPSNASITLTTSRAAGAHATVSVTDSNPQGGSSSDTFAADSPNPGNAVSASQVSAAATGNSFVWGAANTQVSAGGTAKSLAVGAVADTSGSMFLAVGDLDGLSIATNVQNSVLYGGGDVTFGASGAFDKQTAVQVYVGPSYRTIDQWNKTTTSLTVDLPEVAGTTVVHPLYSLDRNANVFSNYLGAVVGASVAHQVSDAVSVSVGAEASLYYTRATLSGRDAVTIVGGSGDASLPYPSQTVTYGSGTSTSNNGLAFAIRGQTAVTFAINPKLDLTFAGSVDYLSRVARPNGGANVVYTANATDANATWSSSSTPLLSFGDMWAFTATGSLTGHF